MDESNRRRAGNFGAAIAGASAIAIAVVKVGPVGGLVVVLVTVGVLAGLFVTLFSFDRRKRARRLRDGEVASAGATIRGHELRRTSPDVTIQGADGALITGDLTVSKTGLEWRPSRRFQRRGIPGATYSWSNIDRIEVGRLRSLIPCDALAVVEKNGKDTIFYVTAPSHIEAAISALGVRLDRP